MRAVAIVYYALGTIAAAAAWWLWGPWAGIGIVAGQAALAAVAWTAIDIGWQAGYEEGREESLAERNGQAKTAKTSSRGETPCTCRQRGQH